MAVFGEKFSGKIIEKADGVVLRLPMVEKTDHITFGFVEISEGKHTVEHSHDEGEEFLYVIEGSGYAVIDGEKDEIKKEDLIFIKSHQKHQILNTGKICLKLLMGTSPPLEF
jgi:mannose-6-phosphate isomerase-like protein (cupin superfamily)